MLIAYQILKDSSFICLPCSRIGPFKGGPDNVLPVFNGEVIGSKLKCCKCNTKLCDVLEILRAKAPVEEEAPAPKKRGRPAKK